MFYDYTSANFHTRELTPTERHRAEYMKETRTEETPEKAIEQPSRESAVILRNLFASASRFARLA
jgi:hypothetical protein